MAGEMTVEEATAILGKSPWEAQGKLPEMTWPTPTAKDATGRAYTRDGGKKGKERPSLVGKARMFPTPTGADGYRGADTFGAGNLTLQGAARQMVPTPDASPHKHRLQGDSQQSRSLMAQAGGQLNPEWVEWLMGWPIGWTAFEPLGTAWSRWQRLAPSPLSASASIEGAQRAEVVA